MERVNTCVNGDAVWLKLRCDPVVMVGCVKGFAAVNQSVGNLVGSAPYNFVATCSFGHKTASLLRRRSRDRQRA